MRHWILVFAVGLLLILWPGTEQSTVQAAGLNSFGGFDCSTVSEIPQMECAALVALYNSSNGPNWTNNAGWLQTNTPCSWYGVSCGNQERVSSLNLSANQLSGSIPPELGSLGFMVTLNLSANQLSGSIPPELGELAGLVGLNLSANQLSGGIPPELRHLGFLLYLNLGANQLSGGIPPELGNLNGLETLILSNNQLSGSIPAQLSNLTNLFALDLGYNMLWANDQQAQNWADQYDPDWESSQTVPPTEVDANSLGGTSIEVSWTPILYTQDSGYYEVSYSLTSGGPYTVAGTTSSKSDSTLTVNNLQPSTTYYFVVRAFTAAHDAQQNDLLSPPSREVSATTGDQPTAVQLTAWTVRPAPVSLSGLGGWAAGLGMVLGLWWYRRRR
jgi:hypothetical protein